MHTLSALLVAAAAACALARPSGSTMAAEMSQLVPPQGLVQPPLRPARQYLNEIILPPLMTPRFLGYEESPRIFPLRDSEHDWLNREIDRINEMDEEEDGPNSYEMDIPRWIPREQDEPRSYEEPVRMRDMQRYLPEILRSRSYDLLPSPPRRDEITRLTHKTKVPHENIARQEEKKKMFALTPLDKGYFEPEEKTRTQKSGQLHEDGESKIIELEPPRQIRQNPNLSRGKSLVADDLDRLRTRLANKDYRLPVSLLPTNLRWLKLNHPKDDEESPQEEVETKKSHSTNAQVVEAAADPAESIYGVALIAAVGAALAMVVVGFAFGWYTLSKKSKAAADVDYPAYGVTGPTMDTSGDRKLAHSAHMYHYQHQKQQIIAMERNGLEQRNGSVSDPESEEENEEGDYTVYECPGFATTGDMEVKNPMFSEDPTPATPGKCELVKPQPKD